MKTSGFAGLSAYDKQLYRTIDWRAIQGDRTLRYAYPLNRESVVFDVGGYQGDWAAEITARYGSRIYIFEPIPDFADAITRRLGGKPGVQVFAHGLSAKSGSVQITLDQDRSSVVTERSAAAPIEASLVAVDEFIREHDIREIDLMKINIEGAEYDLLDSMLEKGLVARVKEFQIQFHDFFPDAPARLARIRERLSLTHAPTYAYGFVWENWSRRDTAIAENALETLSTRWLVGRIDELERELLYARIERDQLRSENAKITEQLERIRSQWLVAQLLSARRALLRLREKLG